MEEDEARATTARARRDETRAVGRDESVAGAAVVRETACMVPKMPGASAGVTARSPSPPATTRLSDC